MPDPYDMVAEHRCKVVSASRPRQNGAEEKVADLIMAAHQARIPPSRRAEGYQTNIAPNVQTEKPTRDRALLFTPQASEDDLTVNMMETLNEPDIDACDASQGDLARHLSRISTRRASVATLQPEPTDKEVSQKLEAAGSEQTSKDDLIKTFGHRKAKKILAGNLAAEDGVLYDMSLVRACYQVYKREFWFGTILLTLGCE